MYAKSISARKIEEILEELFHHSYSGSTISRITDVLVEDIDKWHGRSLKKRYMAVTIDVIFFDMRGEQWRRSVCTSHPALTMRAMNRYSGSDSI